MGFQLHKCKYVFIFVVLLAFLIPTAYMIRIRHTKKIILERNGIIIKVLFDIRKLMLRFPNIFSNTSSF